MNVDGPGVAVEETARSGPESSEGVPEGPGCGRVLGVELGGWPGRGFGGSSCLSEVGG